MSITFHAARGNLSNRVAFSSRYVFGLICALFLMTLPTHIAGFGMTINTFSDTFDVITHSYTGVNQSFFIHGTHDSIFLVPGSRQPAWGTGPDTNGGDVDMWPTTAMIGLGIMEWSNWGMVNYNNVTNDSSYFLPPFLLMNGI
jgi:hypothetical protein